MEYLPIKLMIVLSLTFYTKAEAQNVVLPKGKQTSKAVVKKINIYRADTCIYKLINDIINEDSLLNSRDYFYGLYFIRSINGRNSRIIISRKLWSQSGIGYKGVIKVDEMFVLCAGDFSTDFRFRKIPKRTVKLNLHQRVIDNELNDETDFFTNPPKNFIYKGCNDFPIEITLYR